MAVSRRNEAGVGLLLVVAIGLLAWMALRVGAFQAPGNYLHVYATLDSAAGLNPGAVVSIAGVPVGRVEKITVDFDKAKLELSVDAEAGVREDVSLALRARSVLGEKYVALVPRSREAALLKDGATISETHGQMEIDQMVTRLEPFLDAMDPKALQRMGAVLSSAIDEDPERPVRMLRDAETTLHNAAEASGQLPGLIADARETLAVVRRTADDARPVLNHADQAIAEAQLRIQAVPPDQVPALLARADDAASSAQDILANLDGHTNELNRILLNLQDLDKWELRRLLREEGIVVRLRPSEVVVPPENPH